MRKIPCIFPDDQGIQCGEQFASDCGIRQPVSDFRRFSGPAASNDRSHVLAHLRLEPIRIASERRHVIRHHAREMVSEITVAPGSASVCIREARLVV
jgi:hypothetical protein